MTSWRASLVHTIGVAVLVTLLSAPVGPATAAAPRDDPELLRLADRDRFLSPNGDNVSDRARFELRLDERAYVSVQVRDREWQVVRRLRLGVLPAGRHVWHWDGRSSSGEVLPDGRYALVLRAWGSERTGRVTTFAEVLTVPDAGKLVLSRPVVYPAATAVDDSLDVVYVRAGYQEEIRQYWMYYGMPVQLRTRLVISGSDGERVLDARWRGYRPAFSWSARSDSGQPLPAGTYRLLLTVRDAVGNVRTMRRAVEVSSAQLTERVSTTTIPAARAELGPGPIYDPGCNGCGEVCGPVPSDRYAGGLSFRQPCSFGYAAVRYFGATAPVVPAPVDAFRVTATGGPTTPGDTDVAHFDALVMGPGEATVTSPWEDVELKKHPYLPDADQPITWTVATYDENDYDIESFTVEYRYWVPV
jgi:hypothetical protein